MDNEPPQTADADPPVGTGAGESRSSLPICSSVCHVDGNRVGCSLLRRPSVKLSASGAQASCLGGAASLVHSFMTTFHFLFSF